MATWKPGQAGSSLPASMGGTPTFYDDEGRMIGYDPQMFQTPEAAYAASKGDKDFAWRSGSATAPVGSWQRPLSYAPNAQINNPYLNWLSSATTGYKAGQGVPFSQFMGLPAASQTGMMSQRGPAPLGPGQVQGLAGGLPLSMLNPGDRQRGIGGDFGIPGRRGGFGPSTIPGSGDTVIPPPPDTGVPRTPDEPPQPPIIGGPAESGRNPMLGGQPMGWDFLQGLGDLLTGDATGGQLSFMRGVSQMLNPWMNQGFFGQPYEDQNQRLLAELMGGMGIYNPSNLNDMYGNYNLLNQTMMGNAGNYYGNTLNPALEGLMSNWFGGQGPTGTAFPDTQQGILNMMQYGTGEQMPWGTQNYGLPQFYNQVLNYGLPGQRETAGVMEKLLGNSALGWSPYASNINLNQGIADWAGQMYQQPIDVARNQARAGVDKAERLWTDLLTNAQNQVGAAGDMARFGGLDMPGAANALLGYGTRGGSMEALSRLLGGVPGQATIEGMIPGQMQQGQGLTGQQADILKQIATSGLPNQQQAIEFTKGRLGTGGDIMGEGNAYGVGDVLRQIYTEGLPGQKGIQDIISKASEQYKTGSLTPELVSALTRTIYEPMQEQLMGQLNRQGGGQAALNSGLLAELQRRSMEDWQDRLLTKAFEAQPQRAQEALGAFTGLAGAAQPYLGLGADIWGRAGEQGLQGFGAVANAAQPYLSMMGAAGNQAIQNALQGYTTGLQGRMQPISEGNRLAMQLLGQYGQNAGTLGQIGGQQMGAANDLLRNMLYGTGQLGQLGQGLMGGAMQAGQNLGEAGRWALESPLRTMTSTAGAAAPFTNQMLQYLQGQQQYGMQLPQVAQNLALNPYQMAGNLGLQGMGQQAGFQQNMIQNLMNYLAQQNQYRLGTQAQATDTLNNLVRGMYGQQPYQMSQNAAMLTALGPIIARILGGNQTTGGSTGGGIWDRIRDIIGRVIGGGRGRPQTGTSEPPGTTPR